MFILTVFQSSFTIRPMAFSSLSLSLLWCVYNHAGLNCFHFGESLRHEFMQSKMIFEKFKISYHLPVYICSAHSAWH